MDGEKSAPPVRPNSFQPPQGGPTAPLPSLPFAPRGFPSNVFAPGQMSNVRLSFPNPTSQTQGQSSNSVSVKVPVLPNPVQLSSMMLPASRGDHAPLNLLPSLLPPPRPPDPEGQTPESVPSGGVNRGHGVPKLLPRFPTAVTTGAALSESVHNSDGPNRPAPDSTMQRPYMSQQQTHPPYLTTTPNAPESRLSAVEVLEMCQTFLEARGFGGAASAVAELSRSPSLLGSQTRPCQSTAYVDWAAARFRDFAHWVDGALDDMKAEFTEVAYVLFGEIWIMMARADPVKARALVVEFWSLFAPDHASEMEELSKIGDSKQLDRVTITRWKAETQKYQLFVSKLGHRLLFEYLMSQPTPPPTSPGPSLLIVAQSHISFSITSTPVPPSLVQLMTGHVLSGAQSLAPRADSITWGLLAGPFSAVQRLDALRGASSVVPTTLIPLYMENDDPSTLAVINGEITCPVDPNHALPFADESSWAMSRRRSFQQSQLSLDTLSKESTSFSCFPTMLCHSFDNLREGVSCVRVSALDDKWLCLGCDTGDIEVWDIPKLVEKEDGSVVMEVEKEAKENEEIDEGFGANDDLSKDNKETDNDHIDAIKQETPQMLLGHLAAVTDLAFVPPATPQSDNWQECSNQMALSASADGSVRLWLLTHAKALAAYEVGMTALWTVDASPHGNAFVAGGADRLASLWSFGRTQPLRLYPGHTSDVTVVRYWPNSLLFASGSNDSSIKLWDVRTPQHISECRQLPKYASLRHIAVSPNGRLLAAASNAFPPSDHEIPRTAGCVQIWDIANTFKEVATLKLEGAVTCLAFAKGSRFIAVGHTQPAVTFIDLEEFGVKRGDHGTRTLAFGDQSPADLAFSPCNLLLACTVPIA